ncbi:hypothetical protein BSL78_02067 [Apostichopus japonicus]|uniref:Uncharacterized protein n=1 Tax=Stichopus japonicus TaxID=307972 RepID=A0A2G8LL84_STIJA|nr:hypothetical protein BSL78_02067 [Apostichopus japonicus]
MYTVLWVLTAALCTDCTLVSNYRGSKMSGLVKKLGLKAIDENERDSLFYKIKIQFYGPFLFNRTFLEKYWHDATKAKLITSTDLKPSVSRKFVTQLALLEKTFKKVCEAFQEVQFYEKWTSDVTALLHITSEVCQFTSVDNAVLEASKIGFFEELRNSLDNHEHCSFILLYCLKHFLHLLNQVVMQSDELLKPLQKISNDAEKRAGFLKRKGNLMFQSNNNGLWGSSTDVGRRMGEERGIRRRRRMGKEDGRGGWEEEERRKRMGGEGWRKRMERRMGGGGEKEKNGRRRMGGRGGRGGWEEEDGRRRWRRRMGEDEDGGG